MATDVFRFFLARVAEDWRERFPWIKNFSLALWLPKEETFYAGLARSCKKHIFLNFQEDQKPIEVGKFTINVIVSSQQGLPEHWFPVNPPSDFTAIPDGCYRTQDFVGGEDRWWYLRSPTDADFSFDPWYADDYASLSEVVSSAIDDVNAKLVDCFRILGLATSVP